MKSFAKDYMKRQRVLVSYVRDTFGYKRGVVVAVAPGQIGYSQVHHSLDSDYKYVKPHQLPVLQKMESKMRAEVESDIPVDTSYAILHSKAYKKLMDNEGVIHVPNFDKEKGITIALKRALDNPIKFTFSDPDDLGRCFLEMDEDAPVDKDMVGVIFSMYEKSMRTNFIRKE